MQEKEMNEKVLSVIGVDIYRNRYRRYQHSVIVEEIF
jgi:hypothetical protein